ncbi:MAG TPA: biotin--[acetyl-CoA-carboxylase] ligase [Pirellulales bacterium]|nr:biotin--[acetyl-CoA-carboxylase] ligase [Pirellulales bacterium]
MLSPSSPSASEFATFDWSSLVAGGFADRVEYFPSLASTNDHARDRAASLPYHEMLLVVADEQTAGRGRGTNRWWTGSGSLPFSLLFDPARRNIERRCYPMISLAAAIALVETAAAISGRFDVGLHWPNDVFVGNRKLAGVLIEALTDGRHVLGIGCNVNNRSIGAPPELAPNVTSLADVTDRMHLRTELLMEILERLSKRLDELATQPHRVGQRANELCLQHGSCLTVRAGTRETSGICAGVASDGALLLETPSGRQSLYSGVLVKNR